MMASIATLLFASNGGPFTQCLHACPFLSLHASTQLITMQHIPCSSGYSILHVEKKLTPLHPRCVQSPFLKNPSFRIPLPRPYSFCFIKFSTFVKWYPLSTTLTLIFLRLDQVTGSATCRVVLNECGGSLGTSFSGNHHSLEYEMLIQEPLANRLVFSMRTHSIPGLVCKPSRIRVFVCPLKSLM